MTTSKLNLAADQSAAFAAAARRIRELRELKGMSQEALAIEAGLDQSTLSKAERLGPQMLSFAKVVALAEVLDCTIEIDFRPKPGVRQPPKS